MPEFNTKRDQVYGVYRATVTDGDDPENRARVKVRPAETALAETWARVATWQFPANGEEVIIAFEAGDPRQPYVIGSLWSEQGEPPTAERVALRDTNGNAVTLAAAGVTFTVAAKLSFAAATAEMSAAGFTVSAGMSRFSGVVQADTVITNSVVASSYTPGAGNVW
jgi:phage baseplate assembly protein gpV